MSTFTWAADYGASKEKKPVVKRIQFGDGYSQRATFGLNTSPQKWSLRFSSISTSVADAIDAFLEAAGGVSTFDWTPPDTVTAGKFICESWTRTIDRFGLYTITATFEQVYEP
jgi:phage-related protein